MRPRGRARGPEVSSRLVSSRHGRDREHERATRMHADDAAPRNVGLGFLLGSDGDGDGVGVRGTRRCIFSAYLAILSLFAFYTGELLSVIQISQLNLYRNVLLVFFFLFPAIFRKFYL